jgi:hypothetical protein
LANGNPAAEAAAQAQAEDQRILGLLDQVVSDTERATKERIILDRVALETKQRLAAAFAASGLFADIKGGTEREQIAKALVKIELGEAMGFTPAEAMQGIDVIQGRPAIGANLRAARMAAAGFSWPQMILIDKGCWIPLMFKGQPLLAPKVNEDGQIVTGPDGKPVMEQVVVSFTEKDAIRAGLLKKDNYQKNPRNMFFSRAITNAQRWYAPHVLKADVLTTEEALELPTEANFEAGKADADTPRRKSEQAPATEQPEGAPEQPGMFEGAK